MTFPSRFVDFHRIMFPGIDVASFRSYYSFPHVLDTSGVSNYYWTNTIVIFDIFIFTFVFESECFAPLSRHAESVAS